jgi:hypothetical protein
MNPRFLKVLKLHKAVRPLSYLIDYRLYNALFN